MIIKIETAPSCEDNEISVFSMITCINFIVITRKLKQLYFYATTFFIRISDGAKKNLGIS